MRTYDVIAAIHQARKMGDKTKFGPDCLDQFGATVGVFDLSTRPEGLTLADRLPDGQGADYAVKDRKAVKTELPDGVESGEYKIGNVTPDDLHSTAHKASNNTGSIVYCYTREARLLDPGGDHSVAIDRAIHSGVILLAPEVDGERHEAEARVLAASDPYGNRAPDNWTWSRQSHHPHNDSRPPPGDVG